ncbi:hypothetical protein KC19_VG172600 [Ceratodon purpureus]|uniref:Uncharacterized protein n=1 Tax=Ceratodon purpureus TaxID=3225 RepID=A0A8T0HRG2_CERPU|nr:hypothetical protein KC19_VG172300 [Ceratodon purpureus]KAG0573371.1 hypothetical protein KC19_VG172600 [Ceratodon purpureus]
MMRSSPLQFLPLAALVLSLFSLLWYAVVSLRLAAPVPSCRPNLRPLAFGGAARVSVSSTAARAATMVSSLALCLTLQRIEPMLEVESPIVSWECSGTLERDERTSVSSGPSL